MTPDFRIACRELIPTGIEVLGDILKFLLSPIRVTVAKNIDDWFNAQLSTKIIFIVAIFLFIVGAFGFQVGKSFHWWDFKQWGVRNGAEDVALKARNMIWTFGLIFGALFALVGFANSLHRTQQKDKDLDQREQELISIRRKADAEIFTQAVEQLGRSELQVRLGGLYSLEQLARATAARVPIDKDFSLNILETLAAYARNRSQLDIRAEKVAPDVEACIRILVRNFSFDEGLRPPYERGGVDLRNSHLPFLELPIGSDLRGFDFSDCHLRNAEFNECNAQDTKFYFCDLQNARLINSILIRTNFLDSKLKNSCLFNSDVKNAIFDFADISSASLDRYDDTPIKNLSSAQIRSLDWDPDEPPYFRMVDDDHKSLRKLIEARTETIKYYRDNPDEVPF